MSNRAHQGNTYRKNRRAIEPKKAIRWDDRKMADLTGHTGQSCQFIEERAMCGKDGYPYCPEHRAKCYRSEVA